MIRISPLTKDLETKWDNYVKKHTYASVYHLSFFRNVIEQTYHHKSQYFVAVDDSHDVKGALPCFFINSFLTGKNLVSIPFCDYGGILADNSQIAELLFNKAIELSKVLKCSAIELRQTNRQDFIHNSKQFTDNLIKVKTSKVRMKLELPNSLDTLFSSFSAKLRSQIKKPQKEGCFAKSGGLELLNDFYNVFVYNMRDLGSPVHTKKLMENMIKGDPENTRLFVVYHHNVPIACSLVSGFNYTLVNPWASFKRTYQKIAPNMLLYWEMLNYAVVKGYKSFDFGRSTPEEGTFKFKQQWGAQPEQLFWYTFNANGIHEDDESTSDKKEKFIKIWQKLPLNVTQILGPVLRRHIHL